MRPIDADALIDSVKNTGCADVSIEVRKIVDTTLHYILPKLIDEEPTLDYKPVVYCKDCEYRKEHHYEDDGESPYIKYSCKFTKYSMSDIGYCSMGKRRGGEERE